MGGARGGGRVRLGEKSTQKRWIYPILQPCHAVTLNCSTGCSGDIMVLRAGVGSWEGVGPGWYLARVVQSSLTYRGSSMHRANVSGINPIHVLPSLPPGGPPMPPPPPGHAPTLPGSQARTPVSQVHLLEGGKCRWGNGFHQYHAGTHLAHNL